MHRKYREVAVMLECKSLRPDWEEVLAETDYTLKYDDQTTESSRLRPI